MGKAKSEAETKEQYTDYEKKAAREMFEHIVLAAKHLEECYEWGESLNSLEWDIDHDGLADAAHGICRNLDEIYDVLTTAYGIPKEHHNYGENC